MKPLGKTQRVPPSKCLNCGRVHDACTGIDGAVTPHPGDVTICLMCGHIMSYDDDLRLVQLTAEQINMVAADPRIVWFNKVRADIVINKAIKRNP
jgi:hypothetical protein